ncbi:DNA polymerase III subunit epsilon [Candidatus Hydrogenosomobacter endosymbioticus]|uniref:DNA polymerase III subunit epsilon n=1 Tax=Candidatus Hydrogenosomobacter endosymbioticus TaxID=2558174 RepID=A0ABN6L8R2_9PROT|nr:DNA polymerase III subunit epsilon [Candidatus Hydrogenosomobacter endosymbioticus]BDB96557.1 hypothetical protein HYD_6900 [Candidatus Hydrogenosomobacter endosymbioticus]
MREIVLDTETTGLSVQNGHRLIEIGCVELFGGSTTGRTFHRYINPDRDVDSEAFSVHGISSDFLKQFDPFDKVADEFLEFIADSSLIIHNAKFDLQFINFELEKSKKPLIANRIVDTLMMAREMFPGSPASLNALCRHFDIDLSSRSLHGALLDAQLLSRVYIKLTGGAQKSFEFFPHIQDSNAAKQGDMGYRKPISDKAKATDGSISRLYDDAINNREYTVLFPSSEELMTHADIIKQIGAPAWR